MSIALAARGLDETLFRSCLPMQYSIQRLELRKLLQ